MFFAKVRRELLRGVCGLFFIAGQIGFSQTACAEDPIDLTAVEAYIKANRYLLRDHMQNKIVPNPPAHFSPAETLDFAAAWRFQSISDAARLDLADRDIDEDDNYRLPTFNAAALGAQAEEFEFTQSYEDLTELYRDWSKGYTKFKDDHERARPSDVFDEDGQILQGFETETGSSYPSGHAWKGFQDAATLMQIFPERGDEIYSRALQYAESRVIVGAHFPADVIASRTANLVYLSHLMGVDSYAAAVQAVAGENRTSLETQCGKSVRLCLQNEPKPIYDGYLEDNFLVGHFGALHDKPATLVGPQDIPEIAANLLLPRFSYLTPEQRKQVLASTAFPNNMIGLGLRNPIGTADTDKDGVDPLGDATPQDANWGLINLARAQNGPAHFYTDFAVNQASGNAWDYAGFGILDRWSNDIAGPGGLMKSGPGTLQLTGNNTYAGATTINGGTLVVDGSLTSNVAVKGSGTITGDGTLGGSLMVDNGGTVLPGNSAGTLTVKGDATFNRGSAFIVEIATNKRFASQLIVEGEAVLKGGVVSTRFAGQEALLGSDDIRKLLDYNYVILTAEGGVTGRFEGVKEEYKYLAPVLSVGGTGKTVKLGFSDKIAEPQVIVHPLVMTDPQAITDPKVEVAPTVEPVLKVEIEQAGIDAKSEAPSHHIQVGYDAVTPNQKSVAGAINRMEAGDALYNTVLFTLQGDTPAYDALSGETHATISGALVQSDTSISAAATNRVRTAFGGVAIKVQPTIVIGSTPLAYGPGSPEAKITDAFASIQPATPATALWGEAYGGWGHVDGNDNAAGFSSSGGGFVTGLDSVVVNTWRLGVLTGYGNTSLHSGRGKASVDSYQIGVYGGTRWDSFGLRLGANLTQHEINTRRSVVFSQIAGQHDASYDANTVQLFSEIGYEVKTAFADFEPFAGARYVHLKSGGFRERGHDHKLSDGSDRGEIANLTGFASNSDLTTTTLGLRVSHDFALNENVGLTTRAMFGWNHAFGDITPQQRLALGGQTFTTQGLPIADDTGVIEAGFDVGLGKSTTIGLSYTGQFAEKASDNAIKADLAVRF